LGRWIYYPSDDFVEDIDAFLGKRTALFDP